MEASPTYGNHRVLAAQPDALLCALAARGNEDAFGILYSRYRQPVFAFVYHLLGRSASVDDAEDLTQEIMQKAYANLNTRRRGGSFKSWLFRIARNHTFDHIRARRPVAVPLDEAVGNLEPSNVVSLQAEVERREEMTWLVATMGALPERQRQALVMRELAGQSVNEIAESLETTPESAKQLIKRGRAAVSQAAQADGQRSGKLGRELAAAAPITAIAWLGASEASAAATAGAATAGATGAAVVGGSSVGGIAAAGASGAGLAVVSGKVAATVLAVATIGAGGVVVGEKAVSGGDEPVASPTTSVESRPSAPARSLIVGEQAAQEAVANKRLANQRRARARARAAEKKARDKARKAAVKARAKKKLGHGKSSLRGNKGGNSNATGKANGKSTGGSSTNGSTKSPSQGSGNGSSGTNGSSGGSKKTAASNPPTAGEGKGKLAR